MEEMISFAILRQSLRTAKTLQCDQYSSTAILWSTHNDTKTHTSDCTAMTASTAALHLSRALCLTPSVTRHHDTHLRLRCHDRLGSSSQFEQQFRLSFELACQMPHRPLFGPWRERKNTERARERKGRPIVSKRVSIGTVCTSTLWRFVQNFKS